MLEEIKIENLIYNIRDKQVMLDSDLARLYQCKNGMNTINQAVKRQINKFHDRFIIIDNNLYHLGASLKELERNVLL